jgi:hypothetical protein
MYKTNKTLEELFIKNSFETIKQVDPHGPMMHSVPSPKFFIWSELGYNDDINNQAKKELHEFLENGRVRYKHPSSCNFITLTHDAGEEIASRLIKYGPNSTSSSFTIRFVALDENTLFITCSGWGSSVIELYRGPFETALEYFKTYQTKE